MNIPKILVKRQNYYLTQEPRKDSIHYKLKQVNTDIDMLHKIYNEKKKMRIEKEKTEIKIKNRIHHLNSEEKKLRLETEFIRKKKREYSEIKSNILARMKNSKNLSLNNFEPIIKNKDNNEDTKSNKSDIANHKKSFSTNFPFGAKKLITNLDEKDLNENKNLKVNKKSFYSKLKAKDKVNNIKNNINTENNNNNGAKKLKIFVRNNPFLSPEHDVGACKTSVNNLSSVDVSGFELNAPSLNNDLSTSITNNNNNSNNINTVANNLLDKKSNNSNKKDCFYLLKYKFYNNNNNNNNNFSDMNNKNMKNCNNLNNNSIYNMKKFSNYSSSNSSKTKSKINGLPTWSNQLYHNKKRNSDEEEKNILKNEINIIKSNLIEKFGVYDFSSNIETPYNNMNTCKNNYDLEKCNNNNINKTNNKILFSSSIAKKKKFLKVGGIDGKSDAVTDRQKKLMKRNINMMDNFNVHNNTSTKKMTKSINTQKSNNTIFKKVNDKISQQYTTRQNYKTTQDAEDEKKYIIRNGSIVEYISERTLENKKDKVRVLSRSKKSKKKEGIKHFGNCFDNNLNHSVNVNKINNNKIQRYNIINQNNIIQNIPKIKVNIGNSSSNNNALKKGNKKDGVAKRMELSKLLSINKTLESKKKNKVYSNSLNKDNAISKVEAECQTINFDNMTSFTKREDLSLFENSEILDKINLTGRTTPTVYKKKKIISF